MNTNPYLGLRLMVWADDSTEVIEIVGSEDAQTPLALLRATNLGDEVSQLLEVLDDRERKIVFQRFAVDDNA
jgi:RNA polymerase primary sigma factor